MINNFKDPNSVLFILGPTASGKSGLAIKIAKQLIANGQKSIIISADSRQIYLGLDIITAKEEPRPKPYSSNLMNEPFALRLTIVVNSSFI